MDRVDSRVQEKNSAYYVKYCNNNIYTIEFISLRLLTGFVLFTECGLVATGGVALGMFLVLALQAARACTRRLCRRARSPKKYKHQMAFVCCNLFNTQ